MVSKIMANKQDRIVRNIESEIINNMAKEIDAEMEKSFLDYFREDYIRNEGWYTLKELVKEYSDEQKSK